MSEEWETEFSLTNLRKVPRYMSDHNPLLCTKQEKMRKSKVFCFKTSWLKYAIS